MNDLSKEIWKQLLPVEREPGPGTKKARARKPNSQRSEHWTAAILLERAAYLRKLAKHGDGQASETLKEFPAHAAMLSFRERDGVAELHENFADLFYVLEGSATLVTGGKVVGAKTVGPGEVRGESIEGGISQLLRAGDLAHVPAGLPHQILMLGNKTVTSFVLKIHQEG